jgi:hypothetical protein
VTAAIQDATAAIQDVTAAIQDVTAAIYNSRDSPTYKKKLDREVVTGNLPGYDLSAIKRFSCIIYENHRGGVELDENFYQILQHWFWHTGGVDRSGFVNWDR